jgi:hypothetical protein
MSISGQYTNFDAASVNAFAHLKLPFGLNGEAGLGAVGKISDGRSTYGRDYNLGTFLSVGWAKSLNKYLAFEVQYRRAPSILSTETRNLNSGFRLGLSVKL